MTHSAFVVHFIPDELKKDVKWDSLRLSTQITRLQYEMRLVSIIQYSKAWFPLDHNVIVKSHDQNGSSFMQIYIFVKIPGIKLTWAGSDL